MKDVRKMVWIVPMVVALFAAGCAMFDDDDSTSPTAPTALTCNGMKMAGYCWYVGVLGESCTETCADHGGVTDGHLVYTGTAGSLENCMTVGFALWTTGYAHGEYPDEDEWKNIGCSFSHDEGIYWLYWNTGAATTHDASVDEDRRVCSCVK